MAADVKKKDGFFYKVKRFILKALRMDLMERRNLAGYVFVLPFILGLLLIFLPSMVQSFLFSRSDIVIRADGTGYDLISKGFLHYYDSFFTDTDFRIKLVHTLRDIVINLPVILIFSFFMALLLNRKKSSSCRLSSTPVLLPPLVSPPALPNCLKRRRRSSQTRPSATKGCSPAQPVSSVWQ